MIKELPEGADPEDYIRLTGDGMLEYEVQEEDCLWRINERFYGSGYEWRTIVLDGDAPKDPDEFVWLYCVRSDWIVLYFFVR